MSKISISKEFTWDMAHMLSDHKGACKNLHGHTYRMQVQVSRVGNRLLGNTGHSDGMVMDFSDLKNIVKEKIVEPIDHSFMYWCNSNDPVEHELAELLRKNGRKVAVVNYRPTAEEMAYEFFKTLTEELKRVNIIVEGIRVWETPTSFAEVRRED
ncbi:MAG: 6-carboxytetrahydropterin synthase [Clostridia bacterium]|nr:6-carboxytetrahydropterin synthase [Clostridia bacterium]